MYLFFADGYAEFQRMSNYYVASGRGGCCLWEFHVYKPPKQERTIRESDFVYTITVDGVAENEAHKTACYISKKVDGNWVTFTPTDKGLLSICEVYDSEYIVNPPAPTEEK